MTKTKKIFKSKSEGKTRKTIAPFFFYLLSTDQYIKKI
jgi:hypothetical protein